MSTVSINTTKATSSKRTKKAPARQNALLLGAKHAARTKTSRVVKDAVKASLGTTPLAKALGVGLTSLANSFVNKMGK